MKAGGWVPISKGLVAALPKDRPYSEVEAALCLQCDYDAGNRVTLSGYSALWRWGKGRVIRFLEAMGVRIEYPESTARHPNQTGLITILKPDQNRTKTGLKRLIDSKWLDCDADQNRTKTGPKTDQSRYATRDPDTDPDQKPSPKGEPSGIPFAAIVGHLNSKAGSNFRGSAKATRTLIAARWREGFRLPDFLAVVDAKAAQWLDDPKMVAYLRPATLFAATKFESYLQEARRRPAFPAPADGFHFDQPPLDEVLN